MTFSVKHISISINRSPQDIYAYASELKNLPQWAGGVSEEVLGQIKIKFAAKNEFGILDHDVTLPSGEVFYNPFRVIKNAEGSEVIFTLFRQPQMTDADFEKDAAQITTDLKKLKSLMEKN